MNSKNELLELLEKVPDDKLPQVTAFINTLLAVPAEEPASQAAPYPAQALHELLGALIGSVTNSLYDLSTENERAGAKIVASRLDFSRTKILEAWDGYKKAYQQNK